MKGIFISLALLFSPFVFSSNSSLPSSDRHELCYLDGKAIMLQPNMCYALGGIRGG